jgi:signal transduction histidine kinase
MRNRSLRVWLLVISALFAIFVVGGFALTTFVVVTEGMRIVANETVERVASSSGVLVGEAIAEAELQVRDEGLVREEYRAAVQREMLQRIPAMLEGAGLAGAQFVLRADDDAVIWSSGEVSEHADPSGGHLRARREGRTIYTVASPGPPVTGLFTSADLGLTLAHVPLRLPDGGVGILEVAYRPLAEESVIDAIRPPMSAVSILAMFVMVALMQTSMAWVLSLIANLRRAADSIDAGRLDDRLPEEGSNEIAQLAISLNRLIDRLQRRSDAQGRFVADASHELATPVAGIRGYTSILRAWGGSDAAVREEAIDAIDRESARMARLTSDLLNLLHADQGLRLKSERFDLNSLARERLAATASRYLEKDIEFVGPEDESLVMVGDPDRLEDVLSILLDNAGKYTPSGGSVTLQTVRRRDEVTITVGDTGRGIPATDLPRLFDRFFRSEQARAEGESGFGLGLAIAKSIVESMGGSISVVSELGSGTTFTITLNRGRV